MTRNIRNIASSQPLLSKNPYFSLHKTSFFGKNLVVVYFSANFATEIISKWELK